MAITVNQISIKRLWNQIKLTRESNIQLD